MAGADSFRNVVVNLHFNPPELIIMGNGIAQEVVEKLHQILPSAMDSSPGAKGCGTMTKNTTPLLFYHLFYKSGNCSEQIGQSNFMLHMLDEFEGAGWKLKGSNALNGGDTAEGRTGPRQAYKFFFTRPSA